jgi:hypothetical protein
MAAHPTACLSERAQTQRVQKVAVSVRFVRGTAAGSGGGGHQTLKLGDECARLAILATLSLRCGGGGTGRGHW